MSQIPQYDPPRLTEFGADLNSRVKGFFNFWKTYNEYNFKYINVLRNIIESGGNLGPFQYVASATTIKPLQNVQPITGSVTIQNISTPADFKHVTLLSIDGFTLGTAGNIAAAVTVAAGDSVECHLNMKDSKWYPNAAAGTSGATGPTGPTGPAGAPGAPGASWIEMESAEEAMIIPGPTGIALAAPATPLPITNLSGQYDFSQRAFVWKTFTITGTPCWSNPAGDGDPVGVLQAITSPNGIVTARQTTADDTTRPIYELTSPGMRLPCGLFDGVNDILRNSTSTGTTLGSFLDLFTATGLTVLMSFRLVGTTINNSSYPYAAPLFCDGQLVFGIFIRLASTGPDVYHLQVVMQDTTLAIAIIETTINANTNYVVCVRHDATNLYVSLNGSAEIIAAIGATRGTASDITIGGSSNAGHYNHVRIGEWATYNTAISGIDFAKALAHFIEKWT